MDRPSEKEVLEKAISEAQRFIKKAKAALPQADKPYSGHRHFAATKRAALDVKEELTHITQYSNYNYWKHAD